MQALGCLLKKALNIVPRVSFEYRVAQSRTTNEIGNTITTYSDWMTAYGSVQPGLTFSFNARGVSNPIEIAKKIGLDISKEIITVYAKGLNLSNVHAEETPDQIRYQGKIYNIVSVSNWYHYDNWKSLICVEDIRERSEHQP
jgi:hypothetical protein